MKHTHHKLFIFLILLIFGSLAIVFTILPRSTFSELERRELAVFPDFSLDSLLKGAWTRDVSAWFSDTEPFRDEFMTLNMAITDRLALDVPFGDDADKIAFHSTEAGGDPGADAAQEDPFPLEMPVASEAESADAWPPADSVATGAEEVEAKLASSGILVVGKAPNARALMVYSAPATAGKAYAEAVNEYKHTFGGKVNVYCMPIPTSVEFYCPEKAKKMTRPQKATIDGIFSRLSGVKGVDCHTPIGRHAHEDVYLRTDHHWAPLGAYYAAKAFAEAAGVPFGDLSRYEPHTIHRFVGTMYGYSKDISVKQSPEDFVYYTPTGVDYTTIFTNFNVDKNFRVTGQGKPYKGKFFQHYNDGNGAAYSTFMGGDTKLTQVNTSTNNGRKLLILKDSFGNALPGYLFYSFEEIHVVDFRYFTSNMVDYVNSHGITDILFANGIFNSCGTKMANNYKRFLTQKSGIAVPAPGDKTSKDSKDKTKKKNDNESEKTVTPSVNAGEPVTAPVAEEPAPVKEEPAPKKEEPAPLTEEPANIEALN